MSSLIKILSKEFEVVLSSFFLTFPDLAQEIIAYPLYFHLVLAHSIKSAMGGSIPSARNAKEICAL